MNLLKELADTIRNHRQASRDLTSTALDCSGSVCEFKLPEPLKKDSKGTTVPTSHQNWARPA